MRDRGGTNGWSRALSFGGRVFAGLVLVTLVGWAGVARAEIRVLPATPTETDSVRVTVESGFLTTCWDLEAQQCLGWSADTLEVGSAIQFCMGESSCVCGQFPWTYTFTCPVGRLSRGTYVVRFREQHINLADPVASFTQLLTFSVSESTPTARATWGRLKSLYR